MADFHAGVVDADGNLRKEYVFSKVDSAIETMGGRSDSESDSES